MKRYGRIKNIAVVTLGNMTTILSGVIVGLFLPKILSVADYGWLKTFTLYTNYVGFFHLGVIDGIVLKHGGDDYNQLDRPLFRNYFRWYSIIHLFFFLALMIISGFIKEENYRFICIMFGIYLVAANFAGYFQQISQITQRFKEYSVVKTVHSGLKIGTVLLFFLWGMTGFEPTYKVYLVLFVASELFITGWYLYNYRDLIQGSYIPIKITTRQIVSLSFSGFPLLFANLCSTLILSLDRQFVSILFDTETYAKYAFAYNMLSLVTVALSAISTVLYPTLKRTTQETMKKKYSSLVGVVSVFVFAAVAGFFPLCVFIDWFLPKYVDSLPIFRIVFPGLALSSSITVVMHNYYKALGKNIVYFRKSVIVLFVSCAANWVAYQISHTTAAISIASIITMVFWYLYIDNYFVKTYGYSRLRNFSYVIIMLIGFYLCSWIPDYYIGFGAYVIYLLIATFMLHKQTVLVDMKEMIKKEQS